MWWWMSRIASGGLRILFDLGEGGGGGVAIWGFRGLAEGRSSCGSLDGFWQILVAF